MYCTGYCNALLKTIYYFFFISETILCVQSAVLEENYTTMLSTLHWNEVCKAAVSRTFLVLIPLASSGGVSYK